MSPRELQFVSVKITPELHNLHRRRRRLLPLLERASRRPHGPRLYARMLAHIHACELTLAGHLITALDRREA